MTATLKHPNGIAPAPSHGNNGRMGGKVSKAWQGAWDVLHEWQQGRGLANRLAPEYDLMPSSLLTQIIRMAGEGHLEVTYRDVEYNVERHGKKFLTTRRLAYYRIKHPVTARS